MHAPTRCRETAPPAAHEPLGHHERSRDGAGGSEAIGGRAVPPMPGTSDTNHSRVSGYSARSSCTAAAARTPPSRRHSGPSRKSPDALQNGGGVRRYVSSGWGLAHM